MIVLMFLMIQDPIPIQFELLEPAVFSIRDHQQLNTILGERGDRSFLELAQFWDGQKTQNTKNHKMSLALFFLAAQQGDVDACFQLGVMFQYHLGNPGDLKQARSWYGKAAEKGDPRSKMQLAWLDFFEDKLVDKTTENDRIENKFIPGTIHSEMNSNFSEPLAGKNWIVPQTGMEFIWIQPGNFMRNLKGEWFQVSLTQGFWLGTYEVRQDEFESLMGFNPSFFQGPASRPVERVNWFMVQDFMNRMNVLASDDSYLFRLPTEAEWEYACRAGTRTAFAFGTELDPGVANYDGRYRMNEGKTGVFRGFTSSVGAFPGNAWGFRDMHGNVYEWVLDDFCDYPLSNQDDPFLHCDSGNKVIRGGSWFFSEQAARSDERHIHRPQDLGSGLGFRVALAARPRN